MRGSAVISRARTLASRLFGKAFGSEAKCWRRLRSSKIGPYMMMLRLMKSRLDTCTNFDVENRARYSDQALPDKIGCEDARKERSPMDDSSKTPPNILLSTILAGVGRSSPVMSELALSSLSPRYGPNAKKPVPKLASTNGRVGSGFWSLEPGRRSDA